METINVHIAGRDYPLQAPASQVERLKQAAEEVNQQFDTFKEQFAVEDSTDLLAITALHFASEDAVHKQEQVTEAHLKPSISSVQHLDELSKRIQILLEVWFNQSPMEPTTLFIGSLAGLALGAVLGYFIFNRMLNKQANQILSKAESQGENIKEKKILQAKEKFIQLKEKHNTEIKERSAKVQSREDKIRNEFNQLKRDQDRVKSSDVFNQKEKEKVEQRLSALDNKSKELEKNRQRSVELLEQISNMSADDAKSALQEQILQEAKAMASTQVQDILDEAKQKANHDAKKIVIQTIQRVATEHSVENSVSVFNITNDDVKGRIIGREGRNIRALEAATGVEFIVDDTPEAIILSCFDPVRREVARLSLHQLVTDGRIHPARIEEVVVKVKKKIEEEILEIGKRTCIDLGIHNMKGDLTRMIGRMKYRSSCLLYTSDAADE